MDIDKALGRFRNLRGLFALWIMLGHCCMVMNEPGPLLVLMQKADLIFVGFFLFLSGWGLSRAVMERPGYLKAFLLRKPFRLYLLALLSILINDLLLLLLGHEPDGSGSLSAYLWLLVSDHMNWYIYEQIFFYLLFYLCCVLIRKEKQRAWTMLLLCLFLLELLRHTTLGWAYLYSALAFPLGVLLAAYRKTAGDVLHEHPRAVYLLLIVAAAAFGLSMRFASRSAGAVYGRNLICICACLLVAGLLARVSTGGWFLTHTARLSMGIYLYHFVAINLASTYLARHHLAGGYLFLFLSALLTMLLAQLEYSFRGLVKNVRNFQKKIVDTQV